MSFSETLKYLREKKGLYQKELADVLDLSRSTITAYESGKREPDHDTLRKIAIFFNVSIDYLLGRYDLPLDAIPVGKRIYLPIVGTVKAGPCGVAFEEIIGKEWVEENEVNGAEYFWLKVKGDSMYPNFFPGDFVLIRRQPIVEDGQVAVVIVDKEEGCLKRVRLLPNGFALESINPTYPTRYFVGQEAENLMIVGVYKQLKRK